MRSREQSRGASARRAPGGRADQGSISVFAVIAAMTLIMFIAMAVDLSAALHTTQRAQEVARQAARSGAEAASADSLVRGDMVVVDPQSAATAARAYLNASQVSGTVRASADTVRVQTTDTYQPVLLSLVGIGPLTVTGDSTASIKRVSQGVQR